MKRNLKLFISAFLIICTLVSFAGCGKKVEIAIPDDVTNQARALMLLEKEGIISLKEGIDITASLEDIEKNPYNVKFKVTDAADIIGLLEEVDFALINSNYAIAKGINPKEDAIAFEDSSAAYSNIIAVRAGCEDTPETKAIVAALKSSLVADFVKTAYDGAVISDVKNPGDGFDSTVDYKELEGKVLKVAATPTPHAEMLGIAKNILAEKNITLEIVEYSEYSKLNEVLAAGDVDANFFQHLPYMEDYNTRNGTNIVSAGAVHIEPMGIYGGKMKSFDEIK